RLHLVPVDRAFHPAVAARRATAARTLGHGSNCGRELNHRATALLVFFAAAARTWIVASESHVAPASIRCPVTANLIRHSGTRHPGRERPCGKIAWSTMQDPRS